MVRLAWFSPMPPARSGVAEYSRTLTTALRASYDLQIFADEPSVRTSPDAAERGVRSAHDFLWQHRLAPFDLVIYQVGNSSSHDFIWPYLFRVPGLVVLHDARLHHARGAALLRHGRTADYRAEFAAAHPDVLPELAELAVRGFDTHLYYDWPMTTLVARSARLVAVHSQPLADELRAACPEAMVETIRLGHGHVVEPAERQHARAVVRSRHGLSADTLLFGLFGGLTPEKRVAQVLGAFETTRQYFPLARLLLVGAPAAHYDVVADVRARGLQDSVIITGYVEDAVFTEYLAACDVSLNLRWPTAREISGPWLRALAAGCPTVTTDLWHTAGVPGLDPRTWTVVYGEARTAPQPVTVRIDVLDEDHSLALAMRRLAGDAGLRQQLASAGLAWWREAHAPEAAVADYHRLIARARQLAEPLPALPPHLRDNGDRRLRALLGPMGLDENLWSRI